MAQTQLHTLQGELQALHLDNSIRDGIIWKWDSTGIFFSVKTAYFAMKDFPRIANNYNRIWSIKAPPRFKDFGWLATLNRILTRAGQLEKEGLQLANRCVLCKADSETVSHILDQCPFITELYQRIEVVFHTRRPSMRALLSMTNTDDERSLSLIAQFVVWRERCARIFRDSTATVDELMEQVTVQYPYSQMKTN